VQQFGNVLQGDAVRKADIEATGELAGEALAAGGGFVKQMHEGIAGRPFGILGPAAAPVRVIHDGVSKVVYGGVRGAMRTGSRAGVSLLAARAGEDGPALATTSAGSLALGALNGLYGDHLTQHGHRFAFGMELRRHGSDVPRSPEALAQHFPDATSRIAVFVHGLFGDEENWRLFPLRGARAGRRTYGERLQDELSFTPVYLRYNTGLHISRNGRSLARLLEDLVAAWPISVEEIVLIGHSMGGLVARSACHYGEDEGHRWTDLVRHVFSLGSPHLGADLEKGVNVLSWALGRLSETRAFAGFLNARSEGIKDLRYGSCIDEDWRDCDPDEFLRDRCQEVPFLPSAHYYFIGATVMDGPVGLLVGDLLVRIPSASGRGNGKGRSIPFEIDNGQEFSGLTHMDLLNHPAVYQQISDWITRGRSRAAGSQSAQAAA
jgi:pimeloyl-ACP methyl ester carboxylesterase